MVATTFAADTPLAVTGFVAKNGIAGNWLWWNFVMSGMLTVFLYARLWRRAGVMTDIEFAELRYSGKPAAFPARLSCFVPRPADQLHHSRLGKPGDGEDSRDHARLNKRGAIMVVIGMLLFTAFYTAISGLWGVLVTDLFQFALKMGMVIVLAILAVNAVGGIDPMKAKISAMDAARVPDRVSLSSRVRFGWMPAITLFVYLAVIWWSTWYPGAEPGGGGYVAQRIFSAKNEKHGLLATLWFNIAHYALRPWPWILTALASLILYPNLVDKESGYIKTLMDPNVFPPYLRGFMLAAFAAAYMSTIGTQLNWGASYVINDFYRRFIQRAASEKHYVIASQVVTCVADDRVADRDVLYGVDRRSVETAAGHRRRNRHSAFVALVLVAHKRVVRSIGDDHRGGRLDLPANRFEMEQRSAERLRVPHAGDGWDNHYCLDRRDILDEPRAHGETDCFLSSRQAGRTRLDGIAAEAGLSESHAQGRLSLQFANWILGCRADLRFVVWHWQVDIQGVGAQDRYTCWSRLWQGRLISRNLSRGEMTDGDGPT